MAYRFNGTTQGLAGAAHLFESATPAFVMAVRFKATVAQTGQLVGFFRHNNTSSRWSLQLVESGGNLTITGDNTMSAITPVSAGANAIELDTWYDAFLVCRRDPNNGYRLFVNGTLVGSGTNSGTLLAPQLTALGHHPRSGGAPPDEFFGGDIAYAECQSISADDAAMSDAEWAALAAEWSEGLSLAAIVSRLDEGYQDDLHVRFDGRFEGLPVVEGGSASAPLAALAPGSFTGAIASAWPTWVDTSADDPRSWYEINGESWDAAKIVAFNGRAAGTLTATGGLGYQPMKHATASTPLRRAAHKIVGRDGSAMAIACCGSMLDGSQVIVERYGSAYQVLNYSVPDGGKRWLLGSSPAAQIGTFSINDEDGNAVTQANISTIPQVNYDVERGLLIAVMHIRTSNPVLNTNRILIAMADLNTADPDSVLPLVPVFVSAPINTGSGVTMCAKWAISLKPIAKRSKHPGEERLFLGFADYRNNPKDGSRCWIAQFDHDGSDWSHIATELIYENDLVDEGNETSGPGHVHSVAAYEETDGSLAALIVGGDTWRQMNIRAVRSERDMSDAGSWTTTTVIGAGASRANQGTGLNPSARDGWFHLGSDEGIHPTAMMSVLDGEIVYDADGTMFGAMVQNNIVNYNSFANATMGPYDGEDIPAFVGWAHADASGSAIPGAPGLYDRLYLVKDGLHPTFAGVKPNGRETQPFGCALSLEHNWIQVDSGLITGGARAIGRTSVPKVIVGRPLQAGGGNTNLLNAQSTPTIPAFAGTGYSLISADRSELPAPAIASIPAFGGWDGAIVTLEYGTDGTDGTIPTGATWIVAEDVPVNSGRIIAKYWAYFDPTQPLAVPFGRRTTDGGSTTDDFPGAAMTDAFISGLWMPITHSMAEDIEASAFDYGFQIAFDWPGATIQDANDAAGSRYHWFPESVRAGIAMVGSPVSISGFTLDDAVSTPNDWAIGIVARIPPMEWDFTVFDEPITICELASGDIDTTGAGIRITLEQPTSADTDATITADYISAGSSVGGSGVDTATVPFKFTGNDPVNILAKRSGSGAQVDLLISIGGAPPIALSVSNSGLITGPPERIDLHNLQVYGVAVLEDASGWTGLEEDSFDTLADTIAAAYPADSEPMSVPFLGRARLLRQRFARP